MPEWWWSWYGWWFDHWFISMAIVVGVFLWRISRK